LTQGFAMDSSRAVVASGGRSREFAPRRNGSRSWLAFARRFVQGRTGVVGIVLLSVLAFAALSAPVLAPYDPKGADFQHTLEGPSAAHWFGTDQLGRDLFSRLMYGGRVSLVIPLVVVALAASVGTLTGAFAAYGGGLIDAVVLRVADILLAFPGLLLALSIASVLGNGLRPVIIAAVVVSIPAYVRVVRGSVLGAKQLLYVEAARATGAPPWRIVLVHILPNTFTPVLVQCTVQLASVLLLVSALSFLGIGVQPPSTEWGLLVASGREFLHAAPHLTLFSGFTIMLAVLGFNLVGDGLRDARDIRVLGD
jgi:peptide/nickel transport system permease protein